MMYFRLRFALSSAHLHLGNIALAFRVDQVEHLARCLRPYCVVMRNALLV